MKGSLRNRLLTYFTISIAIFLAALVTVSWNTARLQRIADQRFASEMELQRIQEYIRRIQPSLREYLTSWSSGSLSQLLFNVESLRELIPRERPIYAGEFELSQRRLYFLIDSYLQDVGGMVDDKRARRVDSYTPAYERVASLHGEILRSIDELSLLGLRVQLLEYSEFLEVFRRIQLYSLAQLLIATFFAYFLLLRLIARVTDPLYTLSNMAAELSAKRYDIADVHFPEIREMEQLADAFNSMKKSVLTHVRDIEDRKEMERQIMSERLRNLKMEQLLKRMELYTMQAQMNPHFLFNTINAGVQLAVLEEADKTADFMEKLASLFRNNTRTREFFVPLRTEIEGLRIYFDILRVRFPDTLDLRLQVDQSLLDKYRCPTMIIQPLVENSVLHAFSDRPGTGQVTVFVGFDDPVLIISVKDNGSGIPQQSLEALLEPHTHNYRFSSKLMGLENVIQRCYFFYPDTENVISINSAADLGTEIIIRINTEVEPCIES
jgi:two-component system sensor histidine kinase YesM